MIGPINFTLTIDFERSQWGCEQFVYVLVIVIVILLFCFSNFTISGLIGTIKYTLTIGISWVDFKLSQWDRQQFVYVLFFLGALGLSETYWNCMA